MNSLSLLTQKDILILFAYAPAGLGHLRVTHALYNGLPKNAYPLLLGAQDKTITFIHRVMSVHILTRAIFGWFEQGNPEKFFTPIYRWYLRNHTDLIYKQINTIIDQRINVPKKILVIATHFGLAHQIAAIKHKLTNEKKIEIILIVQVTDDSPHLIWYVPDSDYIFVPSKRTKDRLETYGRISKLPPVKFEVNPYPINSRMLSQLSESRLRHRKSQLNPNETTTIHIAIPISGAAVGTNFFTHMIDSLHIRSNRFQFHVITKNAPFTIRFIKDMNERPHIHLLSSISDKEVISLYEKLYEQVTISLEITKPSEQAFKTLISPTRIGGPLLLLSEPVGGQEKDNLHFLHRKNLIPDNQIQKMLWELSRKNSNLLGENKKNILEKAQYWRALILPKGSKAASQFILWSLRERLFQSMYYCKVIHKNNLMGSEELRHDGVDLFWQKVVDYTFKQ